MTKEQWKKIKGMEQYCSVSSFGRIKAHARVLSDGRKQPERILKPIPNYAGRIYCQIMVDGVKTHLYPHRLVAEHFVKNPDKKNLTLVICKNGDKTNCHADNIIWESESKAKGNYWKKRRLSIDK